MGVYNKTIITNAGINAIAQAIAESQTLAFNTAKTSSYAIPDGTNIRAMTSLRDIVQSVELPTPSVYNSNTVQVYARFSNTNIATEYYINTIGVYASLAGGAEFLFAVLTAITPDIQPVFNENSPTAFIFNIQMRIQNADKVVFEVNDTGTATVADLNRVAQPFTGATASSAGSVGRVPAPAAGANKKFLCGDGTWTAPADMVEDFTSSDVADGSTSSDVADGSATAWTSVDALTSGESNKNIFAKISQMFKNIRYLYKMLGTTDISSIGNGTVTNALSVLNANFGKIINSDAELDALSGTCFFGGSYGSTYFGALDYNGVQMDNAQQRTQIVVVTSNLLYRVDDIGTGHEGNWSEWNEIPYNTATLLNSLNNDVANISSLLSSNGETFKFIVLSGVGFDAAYAQTQSNSVSILHIRDTQLTAPFASNNFVAIQWKNGTGNFGFQFVLGYDGTNSNKIAIRTRGNGVWGDWRTI